MKHGKGLWKNIQGDFYDGNYELNLKKGYGVMNFQGEIYKGHFNNDLREGEGEMIWNDGTVYKGEWKKGMANGRGVLITSEGVFRGKFLNNNFQERPKQQVSLME